MSPRTRKFLGTVALFALFALYGFLVLIAWTAVEARASRLLEYAFYPVAGLLWVWPAKGILGWMLKA